MRYELVDGRVRPMGLSMVAHALILANLACEIGGKLRPDHLGLIRIGVLIPDRPDTFYVPDFTVTAAPLDDPLRQDVADPTLIAEIVDPETFEHDYGVKLEDYRTIPSVRDILMISVDNPRVECLRRLGAARRRLETIWARSGCASMPAPI